MSTFSGFPDLYIGAIYEHFQSLGLLLAFITTVKSCVASGARLSGHEFSKKVGLGSELNEQVLLFQSKSATSEGLMVKSFKRIVGSSGGCKGISQLFWKTELK